MKRERRSPCPISFSLDLLGDRWTLLILRDMILGSGRHFRDFVDSEEGIATNILADRLERLERNGIVRRMPDPNDRRRHVYLPTERGLDLIPVLLELIVWGGKHDPETPVTPEFLRRIREDRDAVISGYRERVSKPPSQGVD